MQVSMRQPEGRMEEAVIDVPSRGDRAFVKTW